MECASHGVDFRAMMEAAAEQILLQPIRWDPVLTTLQTRLQTNGDKTPLRVVPVGTTADQLIYNGLKQRNPSIISLQQRTPENDDSEFLTSARRKSLSNKNKIAIIGMAGRFPEAATTDALWNILRLGIDVSKEVPPLRWNHKTHTDLSGRKKNSSRTSLGCWLHDPDVFDAHFFGISAQEATRMDPAQRLALMTTCEAIEQAGIVWSTGANGSGATRSTRLDRVGVYCGVSGNDWRECNAAQKVHSHFMHGSNRAFISSRISEAFNLSGPSQTVDTSSSNTLAPVHAACRSLWARETDTCIVAGAHVMTNPDVQAGMDRAGLLSHSGNCKVFDETADGLCRGEGVASLVFKRLEDALAENDTVLGVIPGEATKHNSTSSDEASGPANATKSLLAEVLNKANMDSASIAYVEMGGPSTAVGDASEVASVVDVLAPATPSASIGRRRSMPLYVGSALANIGHGEATTGLSGIIKVLLMLRENIIPPHIGIHTRVNSKFPAELATKRNTHIHAGEDIEWETSSEALSRGERRRAIVHDVGTISRVRSALLLEECPFQYQEQHQSPGATDRPLDTDSSSHYIIAISPKSRTSLHRNMVNLYTWLKKEELQNRFTLAQLSYTTTARRNHYSHRIMLVALSVEDLCTQLHTEIQHSRKEIKSVPTGLRSIPDTNHAKLARPVVFAFTRPRACSSAFSPSNEYFRQLYETFSHVRKDINDLEQTVTLLDLPSVIGALGLKRASALHSYNGMQTGPNVGPLASMYTQAAQRLGLPSAISFWGASRGAHQQVQAQHPSNGTRTRQIAEQLAHMCIQMAVSRLWRSWGITPVAVVTEGGVDIYSALNFAGVLSDADTIYLAGTSLQLALSQEAENGRLGHGEDWNAAAVAEFERLDSLTTYCKAQIPVVRLVTTNAGDKIRRQETGLSNARLDVFTGVREDNQKLLTRKFLPNIKPKDLNNKRPNVSTRSDIIATCRESNIIPDQSILQEIGPEMPIFCDSTATETNTTLADDLTLHHHGAEGGDARRQSANLQMWSYLTQTLRKFYYAGASILWDQYHFDLPSSSRRVISTLPAYSWDLKEYWLPYVNDWMLLKGDATKAVVAPKLQSTTIHTIVEETELTDDGGNDLRLVVEADISRSDLHGIVQGHVVDGVPLCTPVRNIMEKVLPSLQGKG